MHRLIFFAGWLVAAAATSGSLYFSEIVQFFPCKLCWFQRILMYPLVLLILIGFFYNDTKLKAYVLCLSVPGLLLALYHYLLQWGFFDGGSCTGVSCSTRYIDYFGFVTIPFLSLTAFTLITLLFVLVSSKKNYRR